MKGIMLARSSQAISMFAAASRSNLVLRTYAAAATTEKSPLKKSFLTIEKTTQPKPKIPNEQLVFGRTFTDHMLEVPWKKSEGWLAPKISPFHNLSLHPASSVLHYALECFEGMKAYKDAQGKIRLFRPDMNMKRMNTSCKRLGFPEFDEKEFLECIKELLRVDESWIPNQVGYSLYLRPTMIATQETLGVTASETALLYVICSPVGPYYKTGFDAVRLLATTKYSRAWPGGTGNTKLGANYAPTIMPFAEAVTEGFQQVLWLFGDNHQVTEVGTMNLFMLWKNEKGEKELVTAPLDGTILPGVTRDSILQLTKKWNEFKVSERVFTMPEVVKAVNENRVFEMFGAGTAAIVSPIKEISYEGQSLKIPLDPSNPTSQAGPLTKRIADTIMDIQYGKVPSEWSIVV